MFLPFDPMYLLFVVPALLLAMYAQSRVSSTFTRYARVAAASGLSGAEAAREILRAEGVDVSVEPIAGTLTDHYDPRRRVLRLSEPVYAGRSLSALGVAAHEAGHAIQHARHYAPMSIRNLVVPVASIGSRAAMPLFILGLFLGGGGAGQLFMTIGIAVFSAVVLFQVLTLPVEFDASRRALVQLTGRGIITAHEAGPARSVLTAAGLTYVASALQGILTLLYMLSRRRN